MSEFAEDQQAFDTAFAAAWYKLTARDMGEPKSLSQTRWINTIKKDLKFELIRINSN